ncbi:hypothetical protein EWM64_g6363 [Hericium alpestre]|uniref:Integrase catalytic domain-containing protein n=1 Tax=Hericium alpestre TaxID=135208 RepID=A0A4Y9ZVW0_9AGAM|nr:hypothetical protein EWM64_g6363 [Hericium alpestre]
MVCASPLPPDPLFASHGLLTVSNLTPDEDNVLRNQLMTVSQNFRSFDALTDTNYHVWAINCVDALTITYSCQYITGTLPRPTGTDNAAIKAIYIWVQHDQLITRLLLSQISASERGRIEQQCRRYASSHELWDGIWCLYLNAGIVTQVNYLRCTFSHEFPPNCMFGPIMAKIRADVDCIYSIGTPTADDLYAILVLQALAAHHVDKQSNFQSNGTLDAFTITHHLDSYDLQACEQAHIASHSSSLGHSASDTAAAATSAGNSGHARTLCKHCSKTNHPSEKCWQKFGKPKWQQLKECDRKARASGSTSAPSTTPAPTQAHATITPVLETSAAATFGDADTRYFSCAAYTSPLVSETCSVDWVANTADSTTRVPADYHLDSASTCHLTPDHADFAMFAGISPRAIRGVNGSCIYASGIGDVRLDLGQGRILVHVPSVVLCLVSVSRLCDKGYAVTFDSSSSCTILQASRHVASSTRCTGALYTLNGTPLPSTNVTCLSHIVPSLKTWHRHLGHVNMDSIVHMARHGLALGMPIDLSVRPPSCEHCVLGKQTKTAMPRIREGTCATRSLAIVFADLMGPVELVTLGGHPYSLDLIDDYSSMSFSYLLHHKSEALDAFRVWHASTERSSKHTLGIFQTDNGGEFTADEFEAYLATEGIVYQVLAPYSSAHISAIERLHRTLMGRARTMRSWANLLENLWGGGSPDGLLPA